MIKAFFKIIWWQGVRTAYRRQFWTQMIGMLRHNPTRFMGYIVTCAMAGPAISGQLPTSLILAAAARPLPTLGLLLRVVWNFSCGHIYPLGRPSVTVMSLTESLGPPDCRCSFTAEPVHGLGSSSLPLLTGRLLYVNKTIIFPICLLMAMVWTAGCACPGPRRPAPAPVVVVPPPPPRRKRPPYAAAMPVPEPSTKLKERVIY